MHIDKISVMENGWIQADGITWIYGPPLHRSSVKTDWIQMRLTALPQLIPVAGREKPHLFRDIMAGKSKLLLDMRTVEGSLQTVPGATKPRPILPLTPASFVPTSSCVIAPSDLIVIGEHYRLEVNGLDLRLPERWTGRVSYSSGALDIGSWHRTLPKAAAPASLEGGILSVGNLDLGHETLLREFTLRPNETGMDFGIRGNIGSGIVRGDGALGLLIQPKLLELTLVGEGLSLESFREWMREEKNATGSINQARFTFRGNPADPINADSSLRLVARDVRWEGRGWESLRLAATLTGRNLMLSELSLRQRDNEVTASGQSHLPGDWRAALRAPFTARFHAELEDAGALAELAGSGFAQLGGGLSLDGEVQGSENRASGYCNLTGTDMTIRKLPLDWVKGSLIFDGDQTKLPSLEAWSGHDHLSLSGSAANSRPHAYKAEAKGEIRDLTKRLAQIGITTAPVIGAGGVKFHWKGEGHADVHTGSFETQVSDWVSKWTTTGMSGTFEGTYAPDKVVLSKAEFTQDDLSLSLKLSVTTNSFLATDILATRAKKPLPLVKGEVALPFNAPQFWQSGEVLKNLAMKGPLQINLALQGIKSEEFASLLGQEIPFQGILEGSISANGTLRQPDLHASVAVRQFSPKQAGPTADLAVSLDAADGKAKAKLSQLPATASPLSLELEMPLHFVDDHGILVLGDVDQPILGMANFRHVPLDGWASLVRMETWPLRGAKLDGQIQLKGTMQRPETSGKLMIDAEEADLLSPWLLDHLSIPVSLNNTNASFGPGTARYHGEPVYLEGSGVWGSAAWKGNLCIRGTSLPVTLGCGFEALATTDLQLSVGGDKTPTLSGNVEFTSLFGSSRVALTPGFAPPACLITPESFAPCLMSQGGLKNLQLEMTLQSDGVIPIQSAAENHKKNENDHEKNNPLPDRAALGMDLRLHGPLSAPALSGILEAKNFELEVPCGSFFLPEARVEINEPESTITGITAPRTTDAGRFSLTIGGTFQHPQISFLGPPDVNASRMMLSLANPVEGSPGLLNQAVAWRRQDMLFPLPATPWVFSHLGNYEPGSLGFYGAPWIWNITWRPSAKR